MVFPLSAIQHAQTHTQHTLTWTMTSGVLDADVSGSGVWRVFSRFFLLHRALTSIAAMTKRIKLYFVISCVCSNAHSTDSSLNYAQESTGSLFIIIQHQSRWEKKEKRQQQQHHGEWIDESRRGCADVITCSGNDSPVIYMEIINFLENFNTHNG